MLSVTTSDRPCPHGRLCPHWRLRVKRRCRFSAKHIMSLCTRDCLEAAFWNLRDAVDEPTIYVCGEFADLQRLTAKLKH